jgi:hypothetical protein
MKKYVLTGSALLFLICLLNGSISGSGKSGATRHFGDNIYKLMAKDICESPALPVMTKIAVLPFSYADKKRSDFGAMISGLLTSRIEILGKFKVIEQKIVDDTIDELRIEDTGIIDSETMKDIGRILGVEAIVTGTLRNTLDDNKYIDVCLTSTDTGEIIATTGAEIAKPLEESEQGENKSQESFEDKSKPIGIR